jgi:hypothetical protein
LDCKRRKAKKNGFVLAHVVYNDLQGGGEILRFTQDDKKNRITGGLDSGPRIRSRAMFDFAAYGLEIRCS